MIQPVLAAGPLIVTMNSSKTTRGVLHRGEVSRLLLSFATCDGVGGVVDIKRISMSD